MSKSNRKDIGIFLIKEGTIIKNAMKQMDKASEKILFVADDNARLLGSLTDGDIRRWILNEGKLMENVGKIYHRNCISVKEGYALEDIKDIMIREKIEWIPVIDNERRIVDLVIWEDIFEDRQKVIDSLIVPVVIMAGGEGLRLDPFTKILPKPLLPVGEKAVSEIIIEHFAAFGCKEFYLILGYKAEMVKIYFHGVAKTYRLHYIQEEKPLGTVGGLCLLPDNFPSVFFVTNCDTIIKADYRDIYKFHVDNAFDITVVSSMKNLKVPYGVIEINKEGSLGKIIEKPEYDFLTNTGMYVLNRSIIDLMPKDKPTNTNDLIELVKKKDRKVGIYPVSEKAWFDVGQWEEYKKALEKLQL